LSPTPTFLWMILPPIRKARLTSSRARIWPDATFGSLTSRFSTTTERTGRTTGGASAFFLQAPNARSAKAIGMARRPRLNSGGQMEFNIFTSVLSFSSKLTAGWGAFDCFLHEAFASFVQGTGATAGQYPHPEVCVTAVVNHDILLWDCQVKAGMRLLLDEPHEFVAPRITDKLFFVLLQSDYSLLDANRSQGLRHTFAPLFPELFGIL